MSENLCPLRGPCPFGECTVNCSECPLPAELATARDVVMYRTVCETWNVVPYARCGLFKPRPTLWQKILNWWRMKWSQ